MKKKLVMIKFLSICVFFNILYLLWGEASASVLLDLEENIVETYVMVHGKNDK